MDALAKARELYENIDFTKYAIVDKPNSYTMGNGLMRMTVVHKSDKVEVLQGECEPGCRVQPHTHAQLENVLLYEGEAIITVAGSKHHLTPGATVSIPPGAIHYTDSDIGCKVLVARIPPVEGVY